MNNEQWAKIYAFNCIIEHLQIAVKDWRNREQRRAKIAIRHIGEWYEEGLKYYEKNERSRITGETGRSQNS